VVIAFLACVLPVKAQVAISGQAINQNGQPIPFAKVRVCAVTSVGTPCTPVSTIYLDYNLSIPISNPYTADQYGNYAFYAPAIATSPSFYEVQLTPSSGVTWSYIVNGGGNSSTNLNGGVLGSIPYQSAPNTTVMLPPNTSTTRKYLSEVGTGSAGQAPTYTTIGTFTTETTSQLPVVDVSGPPYNAVADSKVVSDGVVTGGALSTLTSASGLFSSGDVGKTIAISGCATISGTTNLELITTIATFNSATSVGLTAPCTSSTSSAAVIWGTNNQAAFAAALATLTTAGGGTLIYPYTGTGRYLINQGYVTGSNVTNGLQVTSNVTIDGKSGAILDWVGDIGQGRLGSGADGSGNSLFNIATSVHDVKILNVHVSGEMFGSTAVPNPLFGDATAPVWGNLVPSGPFPRDVIIKNCKFENVYGMTIHAWTKNWIIDSNTFLHAGYTLNANGDDEIITNNIFFDTDAMEVTGNRLVVANNLIDTFTLQTNAGQPWVSVGGGDPMTGARVHHNTLTHIPVGFSGISFSEGVDHSIMDDNVINGISPGASVVEGIILTNSGGPNTDNEVSNNLVIGTGGPAFGIDVSGAQNTTLRNNVVIGFANGILGTSTTGYLDSEGNHLCSTSHDITINSGSVLRTRDDQACAPTMSISGGASTTFDSIINTSTAIQFAQLNIDSATGSTITESAPNTATPFIADYVQQVDSSGNVGLVKDYHLSFRNDTKCGVTAGALLLYSDVSFGGGFWCIMWVPTNTSSVQFGGNVIIGGTGGVLEDPSGNPPVVPNVTPSGNMIVSYNQLNNFSIPINVTQVTINNSTTIVVRCTSAGALPVGALTTVTANCGASTDTGLRVK